MSEEPQGTTPSPAEPPRALPARTGRTAGPLGDWVGRVLDIVEMMADATREALLKKRI